MHAVIAGKQVFHFIAGAILYFNMTRTLYRPIGLPKCNYAVYRPRKNGLNFRCQDLSVTVLDQLGFCKTSGGQECPFVLWKTPGLGFLLETPFETCLCTDVITAKYKSWTDWSRSSRNLLTILLMGITGQDSSGVLQWMQYLLPQEPTSHILNTLTNLTLNYEHMIH